jgi:N6-adenosine-specific RNA methylase IME4
VIELPTARGGFGCIVADPPWSFSNKAARGSIAKSANGYVTQPDAWIPALPVSRIAAKRAHLYLWTTDAHADLAFDVVRAWGFDFKQFLKWDKETTNGLDVFGTGNYFAHCFELLLFATRGGAPILKKGLRASIREKVRGHSRKPEALQDLAMLASPGPYLELFGRRPRDRWIVWGNESTRYERAS